MFGIKEFSAIINPPQTAILAIGAGREELGDFYYKRYFIKKTRIYYKNAILTDDIFITFCRPFVNESNKNDSETILR